MTKDTTPRTTTTGLALTPSVLLTEALDDLIRAERSPEYEIDMNDWHRPIDKGKRCAVCMAGAMLAYRTGMSRAHNFLTSDYDANTAAVMFAVNNARNGDWRHFFNNVNDARKHLGFEELEIPAHVREHLGATRNMDYNSVHPDTFHKSMRGCIDYLAGSNL